MQEYITDAIVLDKVDSGELDSRVFLYTKDFGKIIAKAKSLRKITSKLAGHLEPANLVAARIVEKNGVQLIDALTIKRPEKRPNLLRNLFLVKELAGEWQADSELWEFLGKDSAGSEILSILGFDPIFAKCNYCQKEKPEAFYTQDFHFYCQKCSPPGAYIVNN